MSMSETTVPVNSSEPIPGQLTQLLNNVYRLCANNPSMMTGPGTNTYIYGKNELAIFDAGPKLESHINNILAAQGTLGAPITRIFSSHTHSDHSPAVAALKSALPAAEVIGLVAPAGQDYEDLTFVPDVQPEDDQRFEHDGASVQAIHTPGHVANHICFLIEEHGFLTTGDHLMNGSTVVIIPPKGSMKDYIESLEKLSHHSIQQMGPGHGAVIANPQEVVSWTIKHRLEREAKVADALKSNPGFSPAQLVPTVYADVPTHLHPIAELSLHAHLIKLKMDNRAVETQGSWTYVAA